MFRGSQIRIQEYECGLHMGAVTLSEERTGQGVIDLIEVNWTRSEITRSEGTVEYFNKFFRSV